MLLIQLRLRCCHLTAIQIRNFLLNIKWKYWRYIFVFGLRLINFVRPEIYLYCMKQTLVSYLRRTWRHCEIFDCMSSNLVVEIYSCGDNAWKFISGIYVHLYIYEFICPYIQVEALKNVFKLFLEILVISPVLHKYSGVYVRRCDVCTVIDKDQRFGGTCCLHLQERRE
jgi:hypothetical protein